MSEQRPPFEAALPFLLRFVDNEILTWFLTLVPVTLAAASPLAHPLNAGSRPIRK